MAKKATKAPGGGRAGKNTSELATAELLEEIGQARRAVRERQKTVAEYKATLKDAKQELREAEQHLNALLDDGLLGGVDFHESPLAQATAGPEESAA